MCIIRLSIKNSEHILLCVTNVLEYRSKKPDKSVNSLNVYKYQRTPGICYFFLFHFIHQYIYFYLPLVKGKYTYTCMYIYIHSSVHKFNVGYV